jgi:uncharacterized protein
MTAARHVLTMGMVALAAVGLVAPWGGQRAAAQERRLIQLDPPGPREFILDQAGLIDEADRQQIQSVCDKLLTDQATPIVVVTVDAMANHGGEGMRIETFAMLLFNEWQIGQRDVDGQSHNTGILLLVSKGDRVARIELGGYWRHDQDHLAQQIMRETIVPAFKRGDYSQGITAGVQALDQLARGQQPAVGRPAGLRAIPTSTSGGLPCALVIGIVVIGVLVLAFMFGGQGSGRRGFNGSWLTGNLVSAGLGALAYHFLQNRQNGRSRDDDWFSGWGSGGDRPSAGSRAADSPAALSAADSRVAEGPRVPGDTTAKAP